MTMATGGALDSTCGRERLSPAAGDGLVVVVGSVSLI